MSTLHLVRQSAFSNNDFAQCLSILGSSDTIVLMDDACYCINHPLMVSYFQQYHGINQIKIITSHAKARAISPPNNINGIQMSEVVKLTFIHKKVITWQ